MQSRRREIKNHQLNFFLWLILSCCFSVNVYTAEINTAEIELLRYSKMLNKNFPLQIAEDVFLLRTIAMGMELYYIAETHNDEIKSFDQIGSPLNNNCTSKDTRPAIDAGLIMVYQLRNTLGKIIDELEIDKNYCSSIKN